MLLKEVRFFRERVKQNVGYEIRTVSASVCVCVQEIERKKRYRARVGERGSAFLISFQRALSSSERK